jgi:formylglycine-generating enzyme required for sulfatase activity
MNAQRRPRKTVKFEGWQLLEERQALDKPGKKFTQEMMAEKLGIGLATYKKAESGECLDERIALQILRELARDQADLALTPCGEAAPEQDPSTYLKLLHEDSGFIDVRGLIVGSGTAPRLPIGEVFIPLRAAGAGTTRGDGMERPGKEGERTASLEETLEHRRLVIVGDPGGGKSTFVKWLAWKHSGAGSRLFPVLVRIFALEQFIHRRVRADTAGLPEPDSAEWLPLYLEDQARQFEWRLDAEFFRRKLRQPATLILLDGLDEIPDARRRATMARWFERVAQAYRQARFVVTTRPAAYEGRATLDGFEVVKIGELEMPAMEEFLARWAGFLFSQERAKAYALTGELIAALRARVDIRRMARNPLMLTALAVIQWNERRLPDQRADLYESILKWLSEAKDKNYPDRPLGHKVLAIFGTLALGMQLRPGGRLKQIDQAEAAKLIEAEFREVPPAERFAAALAFLINETLYSGIVVSRGEGHLEFWHLTFQEYLAARKCADLEPGKLLFEEDRWLEQEWREVTLLVPGVLIRTGMTRVDTIFATALERAALPGTSLTYKARAAGVLGAARRDLRAWKYEPPDDASYEALLSEIRPIFEKGKAEGIDLKVRVEAAEALGQAGDWRFAGNGEDRWLTLGPDTFLMGAQKTSKTKPGYDPEAMDHESPVHEVKLDAFQIGRYPVTVAEYQKFVEDEEHGYAQPSAWRHGWQPDNAVPREWDEQILHPTRPVVNVNWFEATAYCEWAELRLPTEAEWEYAARGTEGRKYPWGKDAPNANLANYYGEVRFGSASPVGLFPSGATPEGILDLAGNVWEWCADWYGENYYKNSPLENPTGPESGSERCLRGGSWSDPVTYLRAASRNWLRPGDGDSYFGFRCAREVVLS